jgi:hypothetical protein
MIIMIVRGDRDCVVVVVVVVVGGAAVGGGGGGRRSGRRRGSLTGIGLGVLHRAVG